MRLRLKRMLTMQESVIFHLVRFVLNNKKYLEMGKPVVFMDILVCRVMTPYILSCMYKKKSMKGFCLPCSLKKLCSVFYYLLSQDLTRSWCSFTHSFAVAFLSSLSFILANKSAIWSLVKEKCEKKLVAKVSSLAKFFLE